MHFYGTVRVQMTYMPPYYVVAVCCRPYQPKKHLELALRSLRNNEYGAQKHNMTTYSATEAKWCTAFVLLARLLSLSGCFIAHDTHVWSHTHHILPIEAKEILKYGHRKLMKTKFSFEIKL